MPHRILIVDDEPDELAGWETALRRARYTVATASTAARALELCDEFIFDLVILDYVMPRIKGLELLSRIRKKNPLVRSILVSGKIDKRLTEQEIKESVRGAVETDRYLPKPVKNEDLLGAAAALLEGTEKGRPWDAIAADYLEGQKGSVSKAKGAQGKLKKHIQKG
jgi:two-component system response regulator YesN